MLFLITKYLITAGVIVLVTEVAKRSDKLGAFIVSLPLVTIMVLIWLYIEGEEQEKIANHAFYTFWYVLPTLPMFIIFPVLLFKFGFVWALTISITITLVCFALTIWIAGLFGLKLI
ncbi:DUF3147 family protein [Thiomicrospira sp. R3]|uniref:DUF3147 family protein n=1 Tax=Thiomicrospira sp. R3 TaxID=3035472 RepID=UPI00259BBCCA|nr:DUF3147 family protein [Thiomicrospira sp. R3]WFE68965.1 DUF3147 family protein [Thiomicrospira sp. R3]